VTRVHLVRHGEVENPRGVVYGCLPGFPLSARGRAQALSAAAHLARGVPAAVHLVASPLARAQETAALIAGVLPGHPAIVTDPRLVEAGSPFEGLPRGFVASAYLRRLLSRSSWRAAESPQRVRDRMTAAITDALRDSGGAEVIVVSHQFPLMMAIVGIEAHFGRSRWSRHLPWARARRPCALASVTTAELSHHPVFAYWAPP